MTEASTRAGEKTRETASTAVDQSKEVGQTARDAAGNVAQGVREQVSTVKGDLKGQARQLVDDTRSQLRQQAERQTGSLADSLRTFAEELQALCNGQPEQAGTARRYVEQASSSIGDLASQVRSRSFDGMVQDVQRFARRRPGAFLAAAAAAGFLAGRLGRSAKDAASEEPSSQGDGQSRWTERSPGVEWSEGSPGDDVAALQAPPRSVTQW